MQHTCIKPSCGTVYESVDVEAYYCPPCDLLRKQLAASVDAKLGNRPKKHPKPRFTEADFKGNRGRIIFNANEVL